MNTDTTHNRTAQPMLLSPEDRLAQLEREAQAIREQIEQARAKQQQVLATFPGQLGVATLADVLSILQGGVAQAGTIPAPQTQSRRKQQRTVRRNRRGRVIVHRAHISPSKREMIIRAVFGHRQTVRQIANRHGVSRQAVYAIKQRAEKARAAHGTPQSPADPTSVHSTPIHSAAA